MCPVEVEKVRPGFYRVVTYHPQEVKFSHSLKTGVDYLIGDFKNDLSEQEIRYKAPTSVGIEKFQVDCHLYPNKFKHGTRFDIYIHQDDCYKYFFRTKDFDTAVKESLNHAKSLVYSEVIANFDRKLNYETQ